MLNSKVLLKSNMLTFRYHLLENGNDFLEHTMRAQRADADSYLVHLKAFVVQLFQHNFSSRVTILMLKRVEVQRVYFAPSER